MKVLSIKENYDQFTSASGTKHCHQFTLMMDFDKYDCQICGSSKVQGYCNIGDWVNISISKFTKNQYTLEKIEVDYQEKSFEKTPEQLVKEIQNTPVQFGHFSPQNIPLSPFRGTEAETAIAVSAKFHAINSRLPGTPLISIQKEVIADADIIYAWLMDKKNNP